MRKIYQMHQQLSLNPITTDRLQNVNSTMSMSVTIYTIYMGSTFAIEQLLNCDSLSVNCCSTAFISNLFGHGVLENQIQALSRTFRHRFKDFQTMSVFKDYPGLENLEKLFQDFQGPARALY